MKLFESHFWYNKRQRNGILYLVCILIFLQLILYYVNFSAPDEYLDPAEFALIQQQIDSLKSANKDSVSVKVYPFNPNFLTDYKAYQIGLTTIQIDCLFAFRKKGKFINSAKEFQQITGVTDSLLDIISPYFKFPEWTRNKKAKESKKAAVPTPIRASDDIRDLNLVSAKELSSIKGVSDQLAKRIISYRNKLHGFYVDDQLFEVYYLDRETGLDILKRFKVLEKPVIKKIDINTAPFKEILSVPYVDYRLTKQICKYRDRNLHFKDLEELKKIDSFPIDKFDRIALYLSAQ
jgi:DNA uptake protein ComE-like DNA-binding protein